MRRIVILIFICSFKVSLFADGKMYVKEGVVVDEPYQRAMIVYEAGKQLMLVQPSVLSNTQQVGWIVPVPSVPEVSTCSAKFAEGIFRSLSQLGGERVVRIRFSEYVARIVFLMCVLSIIVTFFGLLTKLSGFSRSVAAKVGYSKLISLFLLSVAGLFLSFISFPNVLGGVAGYHDDIKIHATYDIGNYRVNVIESESSSSLINWLNDNGFHYDELDKTAFDEYIKKRWVFVTALIQKRLTKDEILLDPLILEFKTPQIVYPYGLTATYSKPTNVLIYVVSDIPVVKPAVENLACPVNIRATIYNNTIYSRAFDFRDSDEFMGFPWLEDKMRDYKSLKFIAKFKGKLTNIKDDIVFDRISDKEHTNYREKVTIYSW